MNTSPTGMLRGLSVKRLISATRRCGNTTVRCRRRSVKNGSKLSALIRSLKWEELIALCIFTELSFFTFEQETDQIAQNTGREARALSESRLYHLANETQEA